jgi:putative ABC transport system permease protein
LPAWKAAASALSETMKGSSTGAVTSGRGHHLRKSLVIAQIGVALTLLMGIGVLIQSLVKMQKQDLGFRPQGVLVAHIELPQIKYPSQTQWAAFFEQLLRGVQSLPGVQSAAIAAGGLDLSTGGGFIDLSIEGRPPADPRETPTARAVCVSADLHRTMGMPIVRGRGFTEQDLRRNARSVIIDETLARRYFPDVDPVGRRVNGRTIVGVAATIRDYEELDPAVSTLYLPIEGHHFMISDLVVRTEGDPLRWSDAIRAQVSLLDKGQEISDIHTLEKTLADMLAPRQFTTILLAVFAQITLILAAVGLYGIVQYTVTQGTRDLGIRMALGAQSRDVLRGVLRQGLTIALVGVVVGAAGALAATRALSSLLYGISSTDPATLTVVSLVLMVIALLASYLPARRASRIDPMEALRYE